MLQRILNGLKFILLSYIFIGLSAVAQTLSTYYVLGHSLEREDYFLLALVFCATLFIYNFPVLFEDILKVKSESLRMVFIRRYSKVLKIIQYILIAVILLCALYLSYKSLFLLANLGLLAVLYAFPNLRILNNKNISLRQFPLVKILLLSYVWAAVTVFLPGFESGYDWSQLYVLLIERFLFILALAIPFDIRDYEYDKKYNVITIPVLMGIKNAKFLAIFLLVLFIGITLLNYPVGAILISRFLSSVLAIFLIWQCNVSRGEYYYILFLDGVMILQFVLLALLQG